MAKKQVSKSVKRRLTFLAPILFCIVAVCVVTIFSYAYKIEQLKKEEAALNQQLKDLQTDEKELSSEITKLKDPDYIAKYARENYYYTKDGEYVIKIKEEDKKDTSSNTNDTRSYYVLGAGVVIVFVLIIFIKSTSRIKENKKNNKNNKKKK